MVRLVEEAGAAGRGLARLVRLDPRWADGFALTAEGFVRSFLAPLAGLPLYMLASALVERALLKGQDALPATLGGAALAHLIDAFGFPLLLAAIAGVMRFKAGYAAFVTVSNWASLALTVVLAAASPLVLLGADGLQAFGWISLLLLLASVFLTARIARETLSHELAPVALVVVLATAWSVAADQGARLLVGGG